LKYKLLYLVIDGVADSLNDPVTSLEIAFKPGLDTIARNGVCGVMYSVGRGIAPESDEAVISILGYDPHEVYPGRGLVEALGAGLQIREGYEIAFRANFATIDPGTLRIIDRRVGRSLATSEARELGEALDNMDLGVYDGYARVKATIGHRAVVVIGSRSHRLSPYVSNNDPAYARKGLLSVAVSDYNPVLKDIEPLDDTIEARITAELANVFVKKAIEILREHPVNKDRVKRGLPPANALLLRDAGGILPRVININDRYGCRVAVLAEMPVEIGIGRMLGADTVEIEPPTSDPVRDFKLRLEMTMEALKTHDIVYVHLKGPDEPGHDGERDVKVKRIEEIDKYYVQPLINSKPENLAILVTADHATPPSRRAHTDDPVPVALWIPGVKPDSVDKFTERACLNGSLGVYEHGWMLLPDVIARYLK